MSYYLKNFTAFYKAEAALNALVHAERLNIETGMPPKEAHDEYSKASAKIWDSLDEQLDKRFHATADEVTEPNSPLRRRADKAWGVYLSEICDATQEQINKAERDFEAKMRTAVKEFRAERDRLPHVYSGNAFGGKRHR